MNNEKGLSIGDRVGVLVGDKVFMGEVLQIPRSDEDEDTVYVQTDVAVFVVSRKSNRILAFKEEEMNGC